MSIRWDEAHADTVVMKEMKKREKETDKNGKLEFGVDA